MGAGEARRARTSGCVRFAGVAVCAPRNGEEVIRYIGLDVHKAYIRGYEFRPHCSGGKQERHFRLPNTPAGGQNSSAVWPQTTRSPSR